MIKTLYDLYIHQVREIQNAESQLLGALPKLEALANDDKLKKVFHSHLKETHKQLNRMGEILKRHRAEPVEAECTATKGLIDQGSELVREMSLGVVDPGLITVAQKIVHYGIATYGTVKAYADQLGFVDDLKMIEECLDEEGQTKERLTNIATGGFFSSGVNIEAIAL